MKNPRFMGLFHARPQHAFDQENYDGEDHGGALAGPSGLISTLYAQGHPSILPIRPSKIIIKHLTLKLRSSCSPFAYPSMVSQSSQPLIGRRMVENEARHTDMPMYLTTT